MAVSVNRRKTVHRSWNPLRFLGRQSNRRLRRKPSQLSEHTSEAEASSSEASSSSARALDLHALLVRAAHVGLVAVKTVALLALLGGVVLGGHYTYRRVITSDYFHVRTIEVRSTRRAPTDQIRRLVRSARGQNILTLDLAALRRTVLSHPWVSDVQFERELPSTLRVQVTEHRAQALLLMGHLYLVNPQGQVFKRADGDESLGMPVITGVSRMTYLNQPSLAARQIRTALDALDRYYARVRPALSEVHLGQQGEVTLHLKQGGLAVRMGDEITDERLRKMDAVWAALGPQMRRARVVFLDNVARPDRVTVRMGDY